jgi:hypothetical protein
MFYLSCCIIIYEVYTLTVVKELMISCSYTQYDAEIHYSDLKEFGSI